jgi:hypothetical protein
VVNCHRYYSRSTPIASKSVITVYCLPNTAHRLSKHSGSHRNPPSPFTVHRTPFTISAHHFTTFYFTTFYCFQTAPELIEIRHHRLLPTDHRSPPFETLRLSSKSTLTVYRSPNTVYYFPLTISPHSTAFKPLRNSSKSVTTVYCLPNTAHTFRSTPTLIEIRPHRLLFTEYRLLFNVHRLLIILEDALGEKN